MLVVKYRERLYWQIRRMVHSHDDADDILQNVLIKVWRYLDNFEQQSQLHTWLYRITVNETLTFIRQQKRKATVAIDEAPVEASAGSTGGGPDSAAIQQLLEKAMNTLPEKQRMVFSLRYYDEMPYEEMSRVLDTSVGALKASYHHAVKKIEVYIKQHS